MRRVFESPRGRHKGAGQAACRRSRPSERGLADTGQARRRKTKRARLAEAYETKGDYQRAETMYRLRAEEREWEWEVVQPAGCTVSTSPLGPQVLADVPLWPTTSPE